MKPIKNIFIAPSAKPYLKINYRRAVPSTAKSEFRLMIDTFLSGRRPELLFIGEQRQLWLRPMEFTNISKIRIVRFGL